jgi:hypothetical protein
MNSMCRTGILAVICVLAHMNPGAMAKAAGPVDAWDSSYADLRSSEKILGNTIVFRYEDGGAEMPATPLNTSITAIMDPEETVASLQGRIYDSTIRDVTVCTKEGIQAAATARDIVHISGVSDEATFGGGEIATLAFPPPGIRVRATAEEAEGPRSGPMEAGAAGDLERVSTIGILPGERSAKPYVYSSRIPDRNRIYAGKTKSRIPDIHNMRELAAARGPATIPIRLALDTGSEQPRTKRAWKNSVDVYVNKGSIVPEKGNLAVGDKSLAMYGPDFSVRAHQADIAAPLIPDWGHPSLER